MKIEPRHLNLLAASLALALLPCACSRKPIAPSETTPPSIAVRTQRIEAKPHMATEEVVGTVRAKLKSAIEAKITGRIEKMLVTPGQAVKQGELLAQLDPREVQAKLDQATAVLEQADSELKRFTTLISKQAVTQSEFEAVQSRQRVAKAATTEAETMLGYTRITAPFDGVITRKLADVGDLATPGRAILEMEQPDSLRFEADVPEAIIGKVTMGAKLPVRIGSQPADIEGVVREISPASDPNSRTFLVKLDIPQSPALRVGQFGRVSVPVSETSVLRVPAAAVIQRGQMELVFVAVNGRARLRLVKTGKRIGNEIELLSGVDAGEEVVIEQAAQLSDEQPLQVTKSE